MYWYKTNVYLTFQDYYSYTEVPLQCISDTGEDYTLVQAAFVGKVSNYKSRQTAVV